MTLRALLNLVCFSLATACSPNDGSGGAGGPMSNDDGPEPGGEQGPNNEQPSGDDDLIGDDALVGDDDTPAPPSGGVDPECDSILEVTYRDFSEAHPDFEMEFAGDVVRLNLVEAELGEGAKPVFRDSIGCPPSPNAPGECDNWTPTNVTIHSAETFDQWYRTEAGVNYEIPGTLVLTETPPGSGTLVYDSSEFFPLGADDGFGLTPPNHHLNQNFLFTTEIHLTFEYIAGQTFSFRGDDDLWIFVNDRLALDLGSMHHVEAGTIDFDAQADELGIVAGNRYPMDIFHAERHTSASNFRFETNISCFTPSSPDRVR